jgi:hypothetical protein
MAFPIPGSRTGYHGLASFKTRTVYHTAVVLLVDLASDLFLELFHLPGLVHLHADILLVPTIAVYSLIPTLRISSATSTPNAACFSTAAICSTENRFFFRKNLPPDFAEDWHYTGLKIMGPISSSFVAPQLVQKSPGRP